MTLRRRIALAIFVLALSVCFLGIAGVRQASAKTAADVITFSDGSWVTGVWDELEAVSGAYTSNYSSASGFMAKLNEHFARTHPRAYGTLFNGAGLMTALSCVNGVYVTAFYDTPPPAPPPPPPPPPPTCSVTLDKNSIEWGEKTKIHWSSTRAALFYINGIGYVGSSGSVNVSPLGTTDYSGRVNDAADGSGQSGQCAAKLTVTGGVCNEGEILRGHVCVSQCPVGYTFQNGSCIFNACPSGYVKDAANKCVSSTACTTPPRCEGGDLVDSCSNETIRVCDWGCAAGACKAIPAPSATLKAVPLLVHSGRTSSISWTAFNVTSCSVSGTNGDSWTGISSSPSNSSGQAGKTTSAILGQTIYTLHCVGYAGANPSTIDKSITVNLIPSFNER